LFKEEYPSLRGGGGGLPIQIRQKAHEASAFDGFGKLTLAFGGDGGLLATHNASMRIEEFFDQIQILVVNIFDIIL